MKPLDQITQCLKNRQNFVLQGGAGSGKTETLKQSLSFISEQYTDKKVACITHTNLAADEIVSRVEGDYTISTIHSFMNELIKDFKKNIHQVIYEVFKLNLVDRMDPADFMDSEGVLDEKSLKIAEHKNYKKLHKKYAKKLFSLQKGSEKKVVGKKEYDKEPNSYNDELNTQIERLNKVIQECIEKMEYNQKGFFFYNETRFDSLKDLTVGHDSLLTVASLLFDRFPLISRILQDKYDYIFIDEYQDTHPEIVDIFLNKLPPETNTTVGLFGDSMQGIYDDGIGDVNSYIDEGELIKIQKRDNYRCSVPVVKFLNSQRVPVDKLDQEVAYKFIDGTSEALDDRQGNVGVYYSIYPNKRPTSHSSGDDKEAYLTELMKLISKVELDNKDFKKLMLTNKAISKKLEFATLFNVFNDRYAELNNEIESCLEKLQLLELAQLCISFEESEYNYVIAELKKSGFKINTIEDKKKITEQFKLLLDEDISAIDALSQAMKSGLISRSESYEWYLKNKDDFLKRIALDQQYLSFKERCLEGGLTFTKFDKAYPMFFGEDEEYTGREARYHECTRLVKKEDFFIQLFSKAVTFREVINYCYYLNEKTDYITMHKTKGSGIDNVLVVMDDFFWSKYSFKTLLVMPCTNDDMKLKMQKLFYVACSRAKHNLICVRLITEDEEESFLKYFETDVITRV